jgi:hypothetical protein
LRVADASVAAAVGACGSLAGNAFVVAEALAFTRLSVANALVRAFNHRVRIVCIFHSTNPGNIPTKENLIMFIVILQLLSQQVGLLGAGSSRAISEGPSRLSVDSGIAGALIIRSTGTMTIAAVRACSIDVRKSSKNKKNSEHHFFNSWYRKMSTVNFDSEIKLVNKYPEDNNFN